MRKSFIIAILAVASGCHFALEARAQSASFSYVPLSSGPLLPGNTFDVTVNLIFTSGGAINNVNALSFWFWQSSPAGSLPFSVIGQNVAGTLLPPAGSPPFPLSIAPISSSGLGGGAPIGVGLPSGTYFLGTYTLSISLIALPGTYTLGNTTPATPGVGGRISTLVDTDGDTMLIADSRFNVSIVPEPGTVALFAVGTLLSGAAIARRRRSRR